MTTSHSPAATALRFENVRLIDGSGMPPLGDATVVTDGTGEIVFAGDSAAAPPSPDARVIDGRGKSLLPGFIDCHVHFAMAPGMPAFHTLRSEPALLAFEAAERMEHTLLAGVTSARDLMGTTRAFRAARDRGLIRSPKLKLAVSAISHTGGHADGHLDGGEVHTHLPSAGILADTVDEIRVAVRRILRSGADVIKICTTGGMSSDHDQPDDEGLRLEEVAAIVDEVNRRGGRPIASHAQGTAGIHTAILGGVTSIEHGYGIDDKGLDLLAERGTFLVPTLSTAFGALDPKKMAPHHYEKKRRWQDATEVNIARAIERGAKIAMGTDAGIVAHGENLRELEYLVRLGMSPMDAIVAATSRAAELIGDPGVGVISAGRRADLVLIDGEPDSDIRVLAQGDLLVLIVQDGVVVKDRLSSSLEA